MIDLASNARVGNVDFVSSYDSDLDRPVPPVPPEIAPDESADDFARRAEIYRSAVEKFELDIAAFTRRLRAARETQNWGDVLKPGATPTVFTCRPMTAAQWEAFHEVRKDLSTEYAIAKLLLRMSLVAVSGPRFESFTMPRMVAHMMTDADGRPRRTAIGSVAPEDITETMARRGGWSGDALQAVVEDIGTQVFNHWKRAPVP